MSLHLPNYIPELSTSFINVEYFDFQEFPHPADNFVTFQADASVVGQDEELLPNMPEVEINAY